MVVSTVSTYSVQQTTLNDVSKVQSELQQQQAQLSSGFASQDFGGMSDKVQQYLSLDALLGKTDQYLNDNKVVETRVSMTNTILTQVINTAQGFQSLLSQRLSGAGNTAAFSTQVDGIWQTLVGQLNTTLNNQFLFSGTATNKAPVDAVNFPQLTVPGVPDSNYYHGSIKDIVARPQDSTLITYNVRADAPGFQKLFAGLVLAREGDANNNIEKLKQAEDFVQQGLQDIISTQATVNANAAQFNTIDTNLNNIKLYFKGIRESIGNTDLVSVSTQVAVNQGILQAAFQTFAKITSLRLSDYLK